LAAQTIRRSASLVFRRSALSMERDPIPPLAGAEKIAQTFYLLARLALVD
jgi:hypothetical protein